MATEHERPNVAYAVADEIVESQWDKAMNAIAGGGTDSTVVYWNDLHGDIQAGVFERIGEAVRNSTVPEVVSEIIFNVASRWSETHAGEVPSTLSVVASGYEMVCSCGHQWSPLQLTSLNHDSTGQWVVECPQCKTTHTFDGGIVNHAF